MNFVENIREGLRSVQANLLRSVLTALIVAIGITSLVGILTAIDGIEASVNESLASLGVNTFDIRSKQNRQSSSAGVAEKRYPPLRFNEVMRFVDLYNYPGSISLRGDLSFAAEIKHKSKKTNPNVGVLGVNQEYLAIKGLEIEKGRNFSAIEIQYGTNVAVIGYKVYKAIFDDKEDPINSDISLLGTRFRVIGVLEEKGNFAEDNFDNQVFIPLLLANPMAKGRSLRYTITIGITDHTRVDMAMGEATGVMRGIRHDLIGDPESFEIEKSETLAEEMENITGYLRVGGFGIGFITLLGASIALMNIMLVSVTERTREVGVRKALGATPLRIRQQFIIEAIVVCVLGGIAGILLGIAIGNLISSVIGIDQFVIPWLWMFVGMVVCVVVGLLSGYYPAFKASKLDPIESLRFE
jgi:putative ABC transport system permease protein